MIKSESNNGQRLSNQDFADAQAISIGEYFAQSWPDRSWPARMGLVFKLSTQNQENVPQTQDAHTLTDTERKSIRFEIGKTLLMSQSSFLGKVALPYRLAKAFLHHSRAQKNRAKRTEIDIGLPNDPAIQNASPKAIQKRLQSFKIIEGKQSFAPRHKTQDTKHASNILYVSGMPYRAISSGYTWRTLTITTGLKALGYDISTLHLGYNQPAEKIGVIDSHTYSELATLPNDGALEPLIENAIEKIIDQCQRKNAQLIAAGSNWMNGLCALHAASRLKLPFFYDARGLWPLTRTYSEPDYAQTEAFKWQMRMERKVMREADHVFVISNQLAGFAKSAGVSPQGISVIPNMAPSTLLKEPLSPPTAVTRETFNLPTDKWLVGYAGSVTSYEGLNLMLEMTSRYRGEKIQGKKVCLAIIGDGPAAEKLKRQQTYLGLGKEVLWLGKRSQAELHQIINLLDIFVCPRDNHQVFNIVPALKPLEPMLLGTPCLLSDLKPHRELAGENNERAIIVNQHAAEVWWQMISHTLQQNAQTEIVTQNARQWVMQNRTPAKCLAPWQAALTAFGIAPKPTLPKSE